MTTTDLLVGAVIVLGLVGVAVPALPGSALILGAVLVWSLERATPTGWVVFSVVAVVLALGVVVKYAVPGRRLRTHGVPSRTLLAGGLLGLVGFFVVPVVGLVLGFVLGVYLVEIPRVGRAAAWPNTRRALGAVGLSLLIELTAGLLATLVWLVAAVRL